MAKVIFPSDWSQANGTGSARWMAPELIDPKDDGEGYPSQSDVYSFGMTVLEVILLLQLWIEFCAYVSSEPFQKKSLRLSLAVRHS
jgi:serine/threonine protein kinase